MLQKLFFASSARLLVVVFMPRYFVVDAMAGKGKMCVDVFDSKAPERRFNGCLHQIRKTITKIHIKFIVSALVVPRDGNIFRYSVCLRSGY